MTKKSSLRSEWARQQRLDRRVDAELVIEHRGDGAGDRHVDAALARHLDQRRRGEGAFGELRALAGEFRSLPFAERDAEREVPRLRARAGEDEIPETGETGERFDAGAERAAEPDQLGKAARGQRRGGARTEAASGDDTGGDREHVLG